jgi:hypothetical protein
MRHFLVDLVMVGVVTAAMLVMVPGHPLAAMGAIIAAWVIGQIICAYAFMKALYNGDIVEFRTEPRSYALAPRGKANWRARRFMSSYLRVAPAVRAVEPSSFP